MKSGLFLSAAASILMLGSTAVFAQPYAAPGAITLKPGQVQSAQPQSRASDYAATPDAGLISLKPGQTVGTSLPADYGSVQAGATSVTQPFVMLKPGQAG